MLIKAEKASSEITGEAIHLLKWKLTHTEAMALENRAEAANWGSQWHRGECTHTLKAPFTLGGGCLVTYHYCSWTLFHAVDPLVLLTLVAAARTLARIR